MASNNNSNITIRSLIKSFHPNYENLNDWLHWPPDVFALTSFILQRTGCYRICLIEPTWWERSNRQQLIEKEAENWMINVGNYIDSGEEIEFYPNKKSDEGSKNLFDETLQTIYDNQDLELQWLKILTSEEPYTFLPSNYVESAMLGRELAKAIVELHALADMACSGIGIIDRTPHDDAHAILAKCLANLLLTSTGSLSTIDKVNGIVLPKLRTPQQGQMLRSMSLHLTFHVTEAEVIWRTIPWLNGHERTINVLAIPAPFEVHGKDFIKVSEKNHPFRYFSVKIMDELSNDRRELIESIVDKIIEFKDRIERVHILVFPEISLTKKEYDFLLRHLFEKRKEVGILPIVVAGVLSEFPIENEKEDKSQKSKYNNMYHNEVKIATFFSGRWYDISQRKHHRWRLNRDQLVQYELASRMPSSRSWFEYMSTAQRRLTILAPNSWLSLTALICEDLARLEPVSELIRGIGPTLLTALLSDGPQLSNRWSARYATIFADDPGTSVFSLTSIGMAKRSKKLPHDQNESEPGSYVVGLWRDMINGTKELSIKNTPERMGMLLTLSAKLQEEYTLDGRSDNTTASVFELDTYYPVKIKKKESGIEKKAIDLTKSATTQEEEEESAKKIREELEDFAKASGDWNDIREITLLMFVIDCVIQTKGRFREKVTPWLLADDKNSSLKKYHALFQFLSFTLKTPIASGFSTRKLKETWPTLDITHAINAIDEIFSEAEKEVVKDDSMILFYETLFAKSLNYFEKYKEYYNREVESISDEGAQNVQTLRITLSIPIAISILIDSKLLNWKTSSLRNEKNQVQLSIRIQNLRLKLEDFVLSNYNELSVYMKNK